MGEETDSNLATEPPGGLKRAAIRKPPQITTEYKSLLQEVIEHDSYQTTDYHAISCGVGKIDKWKKKMKKIVEGMTKINNKDLK